MFESFDDIIDIETLMEMLNIGKNTAYTLLSTGEIKAFKIGKKWRIPRQAVSQYIIRKSGC